MKINYQIMTETQKKEGKYYPDYKELTNNAVDEEEKIYINKIEKCGFGFAYNMVYITKLKCGHYEIFQSPHNEHYDLVSILSRAREHALKENCTRCICNI